MRESRIPFIVFFLFVSASVISTHITETIYPALPTVALLSSTILFLYYYREGSKNIHAVIIFTMMSVLLRAYPFVFSPSLVRYDPGREAVKSQIVILTGGIQDLVGFYSQAALFNIFGSLSAMIFQIPIEDAYVVFPISVGIAFPVFAYVIGSSVTGNERAGLIATVIATVHGASVQFSVAPIPMVIAAVFLTGIAMTIMMANSKIRARIYIPMLIFSLAAVLTHKIPILLLTGAMVMYILYSSYQIIQFRSIEVVKDYNIAVFSIVLLFFQWIYVAPYLPAIVGWSIAILREGSAPNQVLTIYDIEYKVAEAVDYPIMVDLVYSGYYFLLVAIGGLCGLVLFWHYQNRRVRILQSFSLITVLMTVPGLFLYNAPGFRRVYVYSAVFVAALIGVGIEHVRGTGLVRKTVIGIIVFAMISANLMSPLVAPDGQEKATRYLDSKEIQGKVFVEDKISETVSMDVFFKKKRVNIGSKSTFSETDQTVLGVPSNAQERGYLHEELLNGTLRNNSHEYVAWRTDVDIYRLFEGQFRLEWNPESHLESNYSKIYSNSGVNVYSRGK